MGCLYKLTLATTVGSDRNEPDEDVRWLRERGCSAEIARVALAASAATVPGDASATIGARERRIAALAHVQPRSVAEAIQHGPSAEEAATEREEEREALIAIFDNEMSLLGGDDLVVPVPGFEPSTGAPPLKLELYMDPIALRGYPIGGSVRQEECRRRHVRCNSLLRLKGF